MIHKLNCDNFIFKEILLNDTRSRRSAIFMPDLVKTQKQKLNDKTIVLLLILVNCVMMFVCLFVVVVVVVGVFFCDFLQNGAFLFRIMSTIMNYPFVHFLKRHTFIPLILHFP